MQFIYSCRRRKEAFTSDGYSPIVRKHAEKIFKCEECRQKNNRGLPYHHCPTIRMIDEEDEGVTYQMTLIYSQYLDNMKREGR